MSTRLSVSICPTIRIEQFDSRWTEFHEYYLVFFEYLKKTSHKNKLPIKSDLIKGILQEYICPFISSHSLPLRM
jgi:hypothetical protein